jgi:hypothetical protein
VLNVIFATLTTFLGPSRRVLWRPEMMVEPLVKVPEFAVGELANSGVLPPATEAIVATPVLYVIVTEYAPSAMLPASIESCARNCCPG